MNPVLLVGAGRFVREVIPLLREAGRDILGVLDDQHGDLPRTVGGVPVLGVIDDVALHPDADVVVSVASSVARAQVVERVGRQGVSASRFASVIDKTVRNPGHSQIGRGAILFAGVTITADANLGDHVVAMPHVTVTHDCVVEDFVTFASGVSLGGGVRVARCAYVGMNASVRQEVVIGENATVGMGAVVLEDVPRDETWVGVPARQLGVSR